MKNIGYAMMIGLLAAGLAACASEEPKEASPPPAEQPAAEQPAMEEPAKEEPTTEQPAPEQPAAEQPEAESPVQEAAAEEPAAEEPAADAPERLKAEDLIGRSTDDVKALYGEPEAQVDDMNYLIWRYDFGTEGYAYDEKVISIDAQGFAGGNMLAQLVVEFGDDPTADAYSVYYMKDGELTQYRATKAGAEEYPAAAD
ncbi:hypothetical protein [Paenibacillus antri]|uniref:hypothetical protein n=1 Tax=Paenibacillus antri TaxID=2582848 RepID=UPI00192E447C|nr:hypothetical protein [Paenibacillus antri]